MRFEAGPVDSNAREAVVGLVRSVASAQCSGAVERAGPMIEPIRLWKYRSREMPRM